MRLLCHSTETFLLGFLFCLLHLVPLHLLTVGFTGCLRLVSSYHRRPKARRGRCKQERTPSRKSVQAGELWLAKEGEKWERRLESESDSGGKKEKNTVERGSHVEMVL